MKKMRFRETIGRYVKFLQKFVDRFWYPPMIGVLAALDNFIIVIPNDGILISSSMLAPKKWLAFALCVTIGSTLGAYLLASIVEIDGLPLILEIYPDIDQNPVWDIISDFFARYGLIVVFFVAVSPLMQQPAVILASLADTPLLPLTLVIFVGRIIKFLLMAYVGSHAPRYLNKMWGLGAELKEAGVELK